jgi:hypothetical protein
LIINPNSSRSILTEGLIKVSTPLTPSGTVLTFYPIPSDAPPAISDIAKGVRSVNACYDVTLNKGLIDQYVGFLLCCCKISPPSYTHKPTVRSCNYWRLVKVYLQHGYPKDSLGDNRLIGSAGITA